MRQTGCPSFGIWTTKCFEGETLISRFHILALSKCSTAVQYSRLHQTSAQSINQSVSQSVSQLVFVKVQKRTDVQFSLTRMPNKSDKRKKTKFKTKTKTVEQSRVRMHGNGNDWDPAGSMEISWEWKWRWMCHGNGNGSGNKGMGMYVDYIIWISMYYHLSN